MPFTRYSEDKYTKRKKAEGWKRIADFRDDFTAFGQFLNDRWNTYHIEFGAEAMADVKRFYAEVQQELGPKAKTGTFSIYLDVIKDSKFVTLALKKDLLVWKCGSRKKAHFVWLGAYQGAHCTATPMEFAKQFPEHDVLLWVLHANAAEFVAPIGDSKVQIMEIDGAQQLLGSQDWVTNALLVINNLVNRKRWIGAKDLGVLLILHAYGGLYFDTTIILATEKECKKYAKAAGAEPQTLTDAVKSLADSGPRLPVALAAPLNGYQQGVFTLKSITTGFDSSQSKISPIRDMPAIEVWAYFCPDKHHAIFSGAAKSYVRRATVLGLDDANCPVDHPGRKELEGDYGDEVIGQLVVNSVYDGLTGALGNDPDAIRKICWHATPFTEIPTNLPHDGKADVKADIIPELGLIKQYKGTWRKKKS